jgi:hypothetical protein
MLRRGLTFDFFDVFSLASQWRRSGSGAKKGEKLTGDLGNRMRHIIAVQLPRRHQSLLCESRKGLRSIEVLLRRDTCGGKFWCAGSGMFRRCRDSLHHHPPRDSIR